MQIKPIASIVVSLVLLVLSLAGLLSAWSSHSQLPLPQFNHCFIEPDRLPDPRSLELAFFLSTDEAHYLSTAAKWFNGYVPTDFNHELHKAAAALSPEETASLHPAFRGPIEGVQALSRLRDPASAPDFVAYRTVYFSLIGVPTIARLGCTTAALKELRSITFAFRLLLPLVLALVIFKLAHTLDTPIRLVLASTGMALAAWDAQLSETASLFLPEVPAVVLLLSGIWLYVHSIDSGRLRYAVLSAILFAATILFKFDFIYALPAAMLLVLAIGWRGQNMPFKSRLRSASLIVLVICLAALAGLAWRNAALTGMPFLTSKDANNLWIGNDPTAKSHGYSYALNHEGKMSEDKMTPGEIEALRQHGFEIAQRLYYRRLFMQRLYEAPLAIAAGLADKAWLTAHNGEVNLFPLLGRAGYWLGWLVNLIAWVGIVSLLIPRRPGKSPDGSLRRYDPGFLLVAGLYVFSFLIIVAVFFLPRFLSHLFPLAIVLAVLTVGRQLAKHERPCSGKK